MAWRSCSQVAGYHMRSKIQLTVSWMIFSCPGSFRRKCHMSVASLKVLSDDWEARKWSGGGSGNDLG